MILKQETPEPIGQREVGNVRRPSSSGAILRKRVVAVFVIVTSWLISSVATYYKCRYPGNIDWRGFAGYETIIGVFVIFSIVQVVRQAPKL